MQLEDIKITHRVRPPEGGKSGVPPPEKCFFENPVHVFEDIVPSFFNRSSFRCNLTLHLQKDRRVGRKNLEGGKIVLAPLERIYPPLDLF